RSPYTTLFRSCCAACGTGSPRSRRRARPAGSGPAVGRSAVLAGALRRQGEEELRAREALLGEGGGDRGGDLLGLLGLDQGDRRAAEASAGHPGAVGTGRAGRVDRGVERGDGDLVVLAQRVVRG